MNTPTNEALNPIRAGKLAAMAFMGYTLGDTEQDRQRYIKRSPYAPAVALAFLTHGAVLSKSPADLATFFGISTEAAHDMRGTAADAAAAIVEAGVDSRSTNLMNSVGASLAALFGAKAKAKAAEGDAADTQQTSEAELKGIVDKAVMDAISKAGCDGELAGAFEVNIKTGEVRALAPEEMAAIFDGKDDCKGTCGTCAKDESASNADAEVTADGAIASGAKANGTTTATEYPATH